MELRCCDKTTTHLSEPTRHLQSKARCTSRNHKAMPHLHQCPCQSIIVAGVTAMHLGSKSQRGVCKQSPGTNRPESSSSCYFGKIKGARGRSPVGVFSGLKGSNQDTLPRGMKRLEFVLVQVCHQKRHFENIVYSTAIQSVKRVLLNFKYTAHIT